MNIKDLSDGELWVKTEMAARNEKRATLILLEHLAEVQRRRLFAQRGFGSLFEYVVKELGYSEAQASERIGAMRLMGQVSEVKTKIEGGSLSLTTAAQIQRFFRSEKKHARKEFSGNEKLALISRCEGQSKRGVERILFEKSEVPTAMTQESERPVGGELLELKFALSPNAQKMLDEVRAREGRDLLLSEIFERSLRSHLEKLNRKNDKPIRTVARPAESERNASVKPVVRATRYVPKCARYATAARSQNRCEFVDPLSGKRCESRYRLQFDHQIPFAFGGTSDASNLKHLCPSHNLLQAIQIFGNEEMKRYVPSLE